MPLADVVASLLSAAAVVLLVRVWHPSRPYTEPAVVAGGAADEPTPEFAERVEHPDSRADVVKAYAPYAIIIAVFVVCQITAVKKLLDKATVKFQWPGLDIVSPKGKPVTLTEFTLNLLTTPGTQMLIAGVLTVIVLKAVGAAGGEGVRNDTASAALGDPHGDGGAGAGVRDEPVRPDDHAWHLDGRGRRSVRAAVADPRLARRCGHRIRHLGQLAVRRAAGHRGEPGRAVRRPDGGVATVRAACSAR